MNTKGLSGDEITKYIKMLNMGYQEGRANLAPEVQQLMQQTKCKRFNSITSKITKRVRINNANQCECNYCSRSGGGQWYSEDNMVDCDSCGAMVSPECAEYGDEGEYCSEWCKHEREGEDED